MTTTLSENGGTPEPILMNIYDEYSAGCQGGASCAMTATTGAQQKDAAYTTSTTLRGNVSARSVDGGSPYNPLYWNWYFYDDAGNTVKTRDGSFVWGTVVEDTSKNYAAPASMTVAGLTSTMYWNDALSLTSASGENGVSSSTSYNTSVFIGRPLTKTLPTGQSASYSYTKDTVVETSGSRWTRTTLDGFGRPRLVESGTGATSTTPLSVVETEYQPCACTPIGKMKRTTRPYVPGATKYWSVSNYDALGRTISVVAPDGASTSSYVYEGASVKMIDAKGKWKKFVKDAVGDLVTVWEPNPAGGSDLETNYVYNVSGKLTSVSKLRGSTAQKRTFTYSGRFLTSKTEPETGTTTFSYKDGGRLGYRIDAKGQKTEHVYEDDLISGYSQKRLKEIRKYPNGTTEDICQRVELFYDYAVPTDGDSGVTAYGSGRLSGVRYRGQNCSQTFVEQYSYLSYGAVTRKRLKMVRGAASGVLETLAEYDTEGRLKSVTYPATGRKVQYGFSDRGLPTTLTDVTGGGSTALVSSVLYGAAGEVTSFVGPVGTETRSYNVNGQMTTLNTPGRAIQYNYPAAGSNNGKIESMTESGETIAYAYDALQRLVSATGTGWAQTYSYDLFGSLESKVGSGTAPSWAGSADAATNRVSGGAYDANGNQTSVGLVAGSEMPDAFSSMSYDVTNRLTVALNAARTRRGDYDYDPGNKRVWEKRTVSGSVVGEWVYFFGITGQRLGRYTFSVAGAAITFSQAQASVWFGGKLVQKVDGSGSYAVINDDRLGSVGKYLPYGEMKPGTSGTNPAADNEKFATYTRDAGTGLDYADQRWYVPGAGRFLTGDPYQASGGAGDPGSWNRFAYTRSEPNGRLDPSGLLDCSPDKEGETPWQCSLPGGLQGPEQEIDPNAPSAAQLSKGSSDNPPPIKNPGVTWTVDVTGRLQSAASTINNTQYASLRTECQESLSMLGHAANMSATEVWLRVVAAAGNVQIHHAATSQDFYVSLWQNTAAYGSQLQRWGHLTIQGYVASFGGVGALSQLYGNNIYFLPEAVSTTDQSRNLGLMLHELLHNVGMNDDDMKAALGINVALPSAWLSFRLAYDCF